MARQVRQTLPDPPATYNQQYVAALARSVNSFMGQTTALAEVVAARFICTDAVRVPGDLPDTRTLQTGTIYLQEIPAVPATSKQVASPAPTSSLTYTMMGLAMVFIPSSTRAVFTMNGQLGNTGNGETSLSLAYGTGFPPPANGAPLTGTLVGQPSRYKGPSAGAFAPFAQTVLADGVLRAGTPHWVDVAVKVTSGTSIVTELGVTVQVVGDSPGYFLTVVTEVDV